jgi:photosystem II stability/assembly factor-like uncharacterized protein
MSGRYVFIAADEGLLVSSDYGTTWNLKKSASGLKSDSIFSVCGSSGAATVYAGTSSGFATSHDYGKNWTTESPESSKNVRGLFTDSTGDNVCFISNSSFYKSTDAGKNWTTYTSMDGYIDNNSNYFSTAVTDDCSTVFIANGSSKAPGIQYFTQLCPGQQSVTWTHLTR